MVINVALIKGETETPSGKRNSYLLDGCLNKQTDPKHQCAAGGVNTYN